MRPDLPDGTYDVTAGAVFEQITRGAGPQCSSDHRVLRLGREHDHPGCGHLLTYKTGGLDTAHAVHAYVHDDDVRPQFAGQAHCCLAVRRLSKDVDTRVLQGTPEPLSQ